MKAVKTYRGDWVVQHHPSGLTRPGVFATEAAAHAAMYVTEAKIQQIYVPMRDGGKPLTEAQIKSLNP